MALVLVSAMRAASETDSEPEFRHMKLANGQPPMLWPISLRSARSARSCDRLGVMMLAIACGLAIASMIAVGAYIGRESCRERVCQYVSISVVAASLKKKNQKKHNP